jgi:glycosidase
VRPGAFTVGEVWENLATTRGYYPDQLTAYFAFEAADSLVSAVRSGNGRGLIAMIDRMQRAFPAGRWGSFQRNHDQTRTMTEFAGDAARARLSATLLLTLPGIPFIYYGEELGMTGTKREGDPRLRTPMHWQLAPAAGFTRALPWEPLQPDSFTANVAVMEQDGGSLLNHYRRLIHLRAATPALGATAAFIPFDTGDDAVLAFARRDAGGTVVVVANLGATRVTVPGLRAAAGFLAPGSYSARVLVGAGNAAPLRVGRDGRMLGWVPVPSLGPRDALVLELQPR